MSDPKLPEWVIAKRSRKGRPKIYHFENIEVGASMFVMKDDQTCTFNSFRVMASTAGTKLGRKFHCRVVPVDMSFECWREK